MGQHDRTGARTFRRALALSLALLAAALFGAAPAAAGDAGADVDAVAPGGVRDYWTAGRMEAATPLDPVSEQLGGEQPQPAGATATTGAPSVVAPLAPGSEAGTVAELERGTTASAPRAGYTRSEVADPTAEGVRAQGKVFLTVPKGPEAGDYVCSGTALNSANHSVVWTAGHCAYDTDGGYVTNFLFVPGYDNGLKPFGEWPAVKLASPDEWRQNGNSSYDFSAAEVKPNVAGETLNEVVGGRGIGFNQPRSQSYASFGYPAEQPPLEFNGLREFRCDSGLGGADDPPGSGPNTMWIGCDMTGGSSGGGWIVNGTLLSVNSYSYCDITGALCEKRLYGPYLNDTAKKLFEQISGAATYCGNDKVTMLGTGGADKLTGTGGKDVIDGGGGKDKIDGKGGKDKICGAGGADTLKGGDGKDKLYGAGDGDTLKGGDGSDSCNGGDGHDTAKSCEERKSIP